MAVSLRDVAKSAGVSGCTASRVLNQKDGSRISEVTRQRVLSVAAELGYSPNRLAQSLGNGRMDVIGLIISELRNPFFLEVLESATAIARKSGYEVLYDIPPSVHGEEQRELLHRWPIDGILMWARSGETIEQLLRVQTRETPRVYLGYPRTDGATSVAFDLYGGGRQVMEHLVAGGRRRILYVTPYDEPNAYGEEEPRHRAFFDVCQEAGLTAETVKTHGMEDSRAAGLAIGQELANRSGWDRPDAIVCLNDMLATGVFCGLRRLGVRVPEEVAVVGFDGTDEAQYLELPLATVVLPTDLLCRRALGLLKALMSGDRRNEGEQVTIPVKFEPRGTA